jgi:hypothetical protein
MIMDLFERFLQVLDQFEREKVDYVLVGGFAVVLHGFPRLTQDIDIFVKPSGENLARLQRALRNVFDDASIEEITGEELDRYPVIRYGTPDGFVIDIIGRIGEAFKFEDIEQERMEVEGRTIRVANERSLIRMKEGTMREVDQRDVRFLREKVRRDSDAR